MSQCFNFLTILFTPCFNLADQMLTASNCCVIFLADETIAKRGVDHSNIVKVSFFPHRITYTFHNVVHVISDRNTVDYIYVCMRRLNLRWMHKVLGYVRRPYKLSMLCKMKLPLAQNESIFRRMVTPSETVIREMCFRGGLLNGDEYGHYFKYRMSHKRSLFEPLNKPRSKETIYLHDMTCYGIYSKNLNSFTIAYMLLGEAISFNQHKWFEIFEGCYYCQIEKYHMIIYKYVKMYIFLDEQMSSFINHKTLPITSDTWINSRASLFPNMVTFQNRFSLLMINKFFKRRKPLEVKSLKHLCQFQITMGLLIRKLEVLVKHALQNKHVFTSISENNPNYIKQLKVLYRNMWELGKQCQNQKWTFQLRGQEQIYDHPHLLDSFKEIISKANMVPIQCHHTMAKLSGSFKRYGDEIIKQYDHISPTIGNQ